MDANTPTTAPPGRIDDLYTLTLVDGLATHSGKQEIRYRVVKLRDTDVNDERRAVQLSERVVMVAGKPALLSSDAEFRLAMTMAHVAELRADGANVLAGAVLDLDLFGRLSTHDLGLIEERIFLITLASQVRYGLISQAEFDRVHGRRRRSQSPTARGPGCSGWSACSCT